MAENLTIPPAHPADGRPFRFWENPNILIVPYDEANPTEPPTGAGLVHVEAEATKKYRVVVFLQLGELPGTLEAEDLQAVICHPASNFISGTAASIDRCIPSLGGTNPSPLQNPFGKTNLTAADIRPGPAGGVPGVPIVLLNNNGPWVPTDADVAFNTQPHFCMAVHLKEKGGQPITSSSFKPTLNMNQGQRNIAIVPAKMNRAPTPFWFQAANFGPAGMFTLAAAAVPPNTGLSQAETRLLAASKLGALPLHPSSRPIAGGRLTPRADAPGCLGGLLGAKPKPAPTAPPGPGTVPGTGVTLTRVGLSLATGERRWVSLDIGFDPAESVGAVHPVDIVQFDPTGQVLGGIRVLYVLTT